MNDDDLPSATVIVAARNEEENILRCLISLDNIVYDDKKLEIILVDDKSTDNTGQIIDEFILNKPKFKKIVTKREIREYLKGKPMPLQMQLTLLMGK